MARRFPAAYTEGEATSVPITVVRESSGPTDLTLGAVADGEFLKRVAGEIVSATAGGGGGGGGAVIFDSGATPVPDQIFNDFNLAFAYAAALAVPSEIRLLTSVTLTSGAYDFSDIGLSAPPGQNITISFTGTATIFQTPPKYLRDVIISMDVAGVLCTLSVAGTRTMDLYGLSYIAASVASSKAFDVSTSSCSLHIRCHDNTQLYCTSTANFANVVNGATMVVNLLDDSYLSSGGGGGSIFFTGGATAIVQVNLLGGWVSKVGGSKTAGYINSDPLSSGNPKVQLIEATHRVYTKTFNLTSVANNNLDLFVNSFPSATKIVLLTSAVSLPNISGITPNGDASLTEHILYNASTTVITFDHNSGSSLAGYRFLCTNSGEVQIAPNSAVHIAYDHPNQAWRLSPFGPPAGGGTTANRPVTPAQYTQYFDTTIGIPVWYVGVLWLDAAGVSV